MLNALRTIVQDFTLAGTFEDGLRVVVEGVCQTLGSDAASIYLYEEPIDSYRLAATCGLNPQQVGVLLVPAGEGLVSLVGERAEPVNLNDATLHSRFRYFPEIGEDGFYAFLGVPVIHQRKLFGVLVVQQAKVRRFGEDEEAFLLTLSAQLASVVAHEQILGGVGRPEGRDQVSADTVFSGVPGSPGIAIGQAVVRARGADLSAIPDRPCADPDSEIATFETAINATRKEIQRIRDQLADSLPPEELRLFDAYGQMLDDNAIAGEVRNRIAEGHWAQGALRHVIDFYVSHFERMEDSYLRERATDVRELGHRILSHLQQDAGPALNFPNQTILVAEEVTPTMLDEVPLDKLAGIVSNKGSGSSHVAILARALDIPSVMGVIDLPMVTLDTMELVVDGNSGEIIAQPSRQLREQYRDLQVDEAKFASELAALRDEPCMMTDDHRIPLWVNVGLTADVERGLERGAEGIGLYRTEIPFMSAQQFPTEEQQRILYRQHLEAFTPRPVTMRTLDIGGDKALSYFPITEDNPFLGWRGIRVTLDHPEILLAQVRAMIKANADLSGLLRIMMPMVSSIAEFEEAAALARRAFQEVSEEGYDVTAPEIGVMIEVPAAAYQARALAQAADFIAVGTNDLTQYMLAVDRNNPRVASIYQELHPAVLRALTDIAYAAQLENCRTSVCGELAGSPLGAVLLTAMGYDVLSMSASNLLRVKWVLRTLSLEYAQRMLDEVLTLGNTRDIHNYLHKALTEAGLARAVHWQTE